MKKIAVIGAGAAGLTATKRISEPGSGFECVTFELSDNVGGTWVYTDKTGKDEYGVPVHSSMYQGLRTNLPKEIMELPDLPHKGPDDRSYLTSAEILQYFEDYADHFDLRKYIKFRHYVKTIVPMSNGRWKIKVTDLKRQKDCIYYFDAVIMCIGNYSNPVIPKITNIENFTGVQMHSHDYKEPSKFKNQTVIVIGSGSSGLDISCQICGSAKKVYLSHHNDKIRNIQFPNNLEQKPDIQEIHDGNVVFSDGTEEFVDAIVYCTGYTYKYPFLDPECKITVENMVVKPLYKHFINIEHPTMCIIGIPRDCPGFTLFDLQVRCFLNTFKGQVQLPSKESMYAETEQEMSERVKVIGKEKYYHILNKYAKTYFDSVSEFGKLPFTRPVVFDIYFSGLERAMKDFQNFRNKIYQLINDQEYIVRE